jgi:hypothetical protein
LTELFRAAGAPDPESWAKSEVDEDIPQLARFLFLRGAWRSVVPDADTQWIETRSEPPEDREAPLAGIAPALNRLLAKGIDPQDLTEVVRVMQYEVLFWIGHLVDDPGLATEGLDGVPSELSSIGWALFEIDDENDIGRPIGGLHESVLETDPTGREMRPRKKAP